jgi:hypothetical protein
VELWTNGEFGAWTFAVDGQSVLVQASAGKVGQSQGPYLVSQKMMMPAVVHNVVIRVWLRLEIRATNHADRI